MHFNWRILVLGIGLSVALTVILGLLFGGYVGFIGFLILPFFFSSATRPKQDD